MPASATANTKRSSTCRYTHIHTNTLCAVHVGVLRHIIMGEGLVWSRGNNNGDIKRTLRGEQQQQHGNQFQRLFFCMYTLHTHSPRQDPMSISSRRETSPPIPRWQSFPLPLKKRDAPQGWRNRGRQKDGRASPFFFLHVTDFARERARKKPSASACLSHCPCLSGSEPCKTFPASSSSVSARISAS